MTDRGRKYFGILSCISVGMGLSATMWKGEDGGVIGFYIQRQF